MAALSQGKMTTGQIITEMTRAITSVVMFTNSMLTLGSTWSSNASGGEKFMRTLMTLPSLFMTASAMEKVLIGTLGADTVAKKFNGGGHPLASGASIHSWEEVDSVIAELEKACEA